MKKTGKKRRWLSLWVGDNDLMNFHQTFFYPASFFAVDHLCMLKSSPLLTLFALSIKKCMSQFEMPEAFANIELEAILDIY